MQAQLGEMIPEWAVLRWEAVLVHGELRRRPSARRERPGAWRDRQRHRRRPRGLRRSGRHRRGGGACPHRPGAHDTEHVITGPERLSCADVAATLTDLLGHPVRHRAVDEDALTAYHEAHGLAPDYARFLAALDTAVAAGSEDGSRRPSRT
ncbi:hypothetical protein V2I01_32055 [Micromonospora sp. BRA006-A]|nr:hypothetical protein [Micromonospora sp. BRA006-A]